MAKGLEGKRVVLTASRKTDEMIELIQRQGGYSVVHSAQGTVFPAEKEIAPDLCRFIDEGADWTIFTTGIGTESLFRIAENIGKSEEFVQAVKQSKTAIRGYKTRGVLKKYDVEPQTASDDGTTRGLIEKLSAYDLQGKRVMVQLYGDTAPKLLAFLDEHGAFHTELLPYQHVPPKTAALQALMGEILEEKADAVCFTTAMQVRFLFQYAKENGLIDQILEAFHNKVLAVAVGKITAEALSEEGVKRVLSPDQQRMGAMIIKLSQYYEKLGS